MALDTITLEEAVQLLQLPRVIGVGEDGEEIVARNGRYGPYVQQGKESRSLETEEQLLTIDLDEAKAILAKPKERRGRGQAKPPLKEVGADPVTGKPIVVKEGRFGPYVTDGETNASLRTGDDPEADHARPRRRAARRAAREGAGEEEGEGARACKAQGFLRVRKGQLFFAAKRRRIQARRCFACARKPVNRRTRNNRAPVTFEVSREADGSPGSRRISLLE